jgi:dienelactone hydrolase
MQPSPSSARRHTAWIDHIPVLWVEPAEEQPSRRLALFLHPFTGTKESTLPHLEDLASQGYVAISLDAWQHGERATETKDGLFERVFGNFRRHMWPILGQTTADVVRVIDWAVDRFEAEPRVRIAGLSMGGDVAVAAAGIDPRIERVAAVVSTADWLRPGMERPRQPGEIQPTGEPDAYARFWYDRLNPLTNVASYAHRPRIHFICGEEDRHVPPDGALRFQAASADPSVEVTLIPGMTHSGAGDSARWWPECRQWLTQD